MNPRVSVITIFYNAADFLGEAIASVLAQDYRDFELLLVDDGSTDASVAVALENHPADDIPIIGWKPLSVEAA